MADVRPIDANALNINDLPCYYGCNCDLEYVEEWVFNAPTLDYAPVRHGKWIYDFSLAGDKFYRCSVCGRQENIIEKEDINEYCPYCHCGAKMDGGHGR